MPKASAAHAANDQGATSALVPFNFRGDLLDVVPEGGRVSVVIRRICDAVGLAFPPQFTKLKSDPSVTVTMIVTVADDGKRREVACIDAHDLPLWLATIHPSKVKPAAREKLIAYKRECADVLADHFLGKRGMSTSIVPMLPPEVAQILREQSDTLRMVMSDLAALRLAHATVAATVEKHAAHPERFMAHQELSDDVDHEEKMRRTICRVANYHGVKPVRIEGLLRKAFAIPSYKRLRYTQFATATEKVLALLERDRGDLPPTRRKAPKAKPLRPMNPRQESLDFNDPKRRPN